MRRLQVTDHRKTRIKITTQFASERVADMINCNHVSVKVWYDSTCCPLCCPRNTLLKDGGLVLHNHTNQQKMMEQLDTFRTCADGEWGEAVESFSLVLPSPSQEYLSRCAAAVLRGWQCAHVLHQAWTCPGSDPKLRSGPKKNAAVAQEGCVFCVCKDANLRKLPNLSPPQGVC